MASSAQGEDGPQIFMDIQIGDRKGALGVDFWSDIGRASRLLCRLLPSGRRRPLPVAPLCKLVATACIQVKAALYACLIAAERQYCCI